MRIIGAEIKQCTGWCKGSKGQGKEIIIQHSSIAPPMYWGPGISRHSRKSTTRSANPIHMETHQEIHWYRKGRVIKTPCRRVADGGWTSRSIKAHIITPFESAWGMWVKERAKKNRKRYEKHRLVPSDRAGRAKQLIVNKRVKSKETITTGVERNICQVDWHRCKCSRIGQALIHLMRAKNMP